MQVTLTYADILNDIRANISMETSTIQDESLKSRIEHASKTDLLKRSIAGASAVLVNNLSKFLTPSSVGSGSDSPPTSLTYTIAGGARRFGGRENEIANKLHEAVVDLALQRFYVSIGYDALIKIQSGQSANVLSELELLLRRKSAPQVAAVQPESQDNDENVQDNP